MGHITMRERARAIGASVQTESRPGQGTKVIITHPLKLEESENKHE
jgi:signal transduction histidine kinase